MEEMLENIKDRADLEQVLGILTEEIRPNLEYFIAQLGEDVTIGPYEEMWMTPESTTSARTKIPILYKGEKVATLYAIAFLPGQCTSDEKNGHTVDEITDVDSSLDIEEVISNYVPRDKVGTDLEAWMSLLSVKDGCIKPREGYMTLISLEDTAEGGKRLVPELDLLSTYDDARMLMTVGPDKDSGERIGDPHAILFNNADANQYDVQVVGFLAVKKDSELYNILKEKIAMPLKVSESIPSLK